MRARSILVAAGLALGAVCAALPAAAQPAVRAPSCTGANPNVAVPNAPHGMFVWVYWGDGERMTSLFSKYVIGKDPTLCGASIVIRWADIEKKQGVYDFSFAESLAKPFTDAGLTVNLLFAESTEGEVEVTPKWVMSQVPTTTCGGLPTPVYWNPKFESLWSAFIKRSIDHFSNASPIKDHIGYMRFATGAGAEAVAPAGAYGNGPCAKPLKALGFSYDVWKAHTLRILDVMASVPTQHQIMASLPSIPGGKTQFEITDAFAAEAAAKHVGLSFESLGVGNNAAPNAKPEPCDPKGDYHWCGPYKKYAGVVPLAMQPITASWKTNHAKIDFTNLLQVALDNKIQIFELYPDEWLQANGAKEWQNFQPGKAPRHKAALQAASMVLGQSGVK